MKPHMDLRDEIEMSDEFANMIEWLTELSINSVTLTLDCRATGAPTTATVAYGFKFTPVQVTVESEAESIRDALIRSACDSDEGRGLIERLARYLGAEYEDVETEIALALAERLPEDYEQMHARAAVLAMPGFDSAGVTAALLARLLVVRPDLDDELVNEMLRYRLVLEIMTG